MCVILIPHLQGTNGRLCRDHGSHSVNYSEIYLKLALIRSYYGADPSYLIERLRENQATIGLGYQAELGMVNYSYIII